MSKEWLLQDNDILHVLGGHFSLMGLGYFQSTDKKSDLSKSTKVGFHHKI